MDFRDELTNLDEAVSEETLKVQLLLGKIQLADFLKQMGVNPIAYDAKKFSKIAQKDMKKMGIAVTGSTTIGIEDAIRAKYIIQDIVDNPKLRQG